MKYYTPKLISNFIGRDFERNYLRKLSDKPDANILVIYGRRRTGKTELIEHVLSERKLLKFEGLEKQPPKTQRQNFINYISRYFLNPSLAKIEANTWQDVFTTLADCLESKKLEGITIFLEELQWMANYDGKLISDLKPVWDNRLRHIPGLLLILCGSSPSFMISEVARSKAIYNRSLHEIHLKQLSLQETKQFLLPALSKRQVLDTYLLIGGIPEYLKYVRNTTAPYIEICSNSFRQASFFLHEFDKIFISALSDNKGYKQIASYLATHHFGTRESIATKLGVESNGTLTKLLIDLELCDLIYKYQPFYADQKSTLQRYELADQYLQYYFRAIAPKAKQINQGDFNEEPTKAFPLHQAYQWLGFSFERWCRTNSRKIADILGFGGIEYASGSFFNRATIKHEASFQLDLVFDRADGIITVCEIKHSVEPSGVSILGKYNENLEAFQGAYKKAAKRGIQRVLISSAGTTEELKNIHAFDKVITLDDLL